MVQQRCPEGTRQNEVGGGARDEWGGGGNLILFHLLQLAAA